MILSSTVMGYMVSHKLLMRVRFLQQYLQFIIYLETEIRYSKRIIYEIVKSYKSNNEFAAFLNSICTNVEKSLSFDKAWQTAINDLPSTYGLLTQDKEIICDFGRELGNTDIDGQIALCKLNKTLIHATLESAKEEKNKKSKLYFMLGSSFGICLTIMLL